MKIKYLVSTILFLLILSLPIVTINLKPDQVSTIDNRKLVMFPDFKTTKGLNVEIENFLSDRIGFRSQMINAYTNLNNTIFDIMVHPTYTYGQEGYIFFQMKPEILDVQYLDVFANLIARLQGYCKDRGVQFLYCLEPTKVSIYSEYLPKGVNFRNLRVNYLLKMLQEKNIRYVDNTPALKQEKKRLQLFNVKYDAGHWNDNGAFVGISNIFDELIKTSKNIAPLNIKDYKITSVEKTTLLVSYFKIHDKTDIYEPLNSKSQKQEIYDEFIQIDHNHSFFAHYINSNNPKAPKIMIFRGSYFNDKEKFIVDNFSEVILIHNYVNVLNLGYYFNIFQPDIVLFQSVEYATIPAYFPNDLMAKLTFNKPYNAFRDLPVSQFAIITGERYEDQKGDSPLTNITYNIVGEKISYAYAKINDQMFDFNIDSSGGGQKINLTIKSSDFQNSKNIEIILVNQDKRKQNIINKSHM